MDELKVLRHECHSYMDMLWENHKQREAVYKWLAKRMRLPLRYCHIGMMNKRQLIRARYLLRRECVKRERKGRL